MNKNTDELIFTAPVKGMVDDPFAGNPQVQNLDIDNIPGIAMLGLATAKKSGTTITGVPKWGVMNNDANQTVYVVDDGHVVYKSDSSSSYATWSVVTHGSPSTGHGNGLNIWKGYLVLAGDTLLDFMLLSSGVWTNGWGGFTLQSDTIGHPIFASVDDKLYIGNGQYVNSIAEATAPFAPGTGASYTATDKLITLKTGDRVRCIEELGANLMIGTFVGNSLTTLVKIARIYPWSRSTSTLGLPIVLREAGIHQMISINNELIFQAGVRGRWYKTNGSTVSSPYLVRVPPYIVVNGPTISHPGAICFHKGKIYSGMTSLDTTGTATGSNVYSFFTDGSKLTVERSISTGRQSSDVTIGCLVDIGGQTNDLYLVGWQDTSAQGVDIVGSNNYTSGYSGVFDTEIKSVGTTLGQKTYTKLEYYLDKKLAANEGLQIGYRLDTGDSYTSLGTFDFASEGAVRTANHGVAVTFVDQIQLRINLTGTTTTPHFKYIRLT